MSARRSASRPMNLNKCDVCGEEIEGERGGVTMNGRPICRGCVGHMNGESNDRSKDNRSDGQF